MSNAYDTYWQILTNNKLNNCGLKYCFVGENKVPHKQDGQKASPNNLNDFVDFYDINLDVLHNYLGLGVSIQGSNLFAIDVDHCFDIPFDPSSADERAKNIIDLFKNITYIEFSFSGTGLRILFRRNELIENYNKLYYIKNSKNEIEFYQPSKSFRYVTVTGKSLNKEDVNICPNSTLFTFLELYMIRPKKLNVDQNSIIYDDNRQLDELLKVVKTHYRLDISFQNAWFAKAPGSNSNESEKDFYLLKYIYSNITKNKEMVRVIFEQSPYFKSKDYKHKNKWNYNDFRYFNYIFEHLEGA